MKDKIIYYLKLFLLIFPPIWGYTLLYSVVWCIIGLPFESWTVLLLAILAGISEWMFLRWVGRWEDEGESE